MKERRKEKRKKNDKLRHEKVKKFWKRKRKNYELKGKMKKETNIKVCKNIVMHKKYNFTMHMRRFDLKTEQE